MLVWRPSAVAQILVVAALATTSIGLANSRSGPDRSTSYRQPSANLRQGSPAVSKPTAEQDSILARLQDSSYDVQRRALLHVATVRVASPIVIERMIALLGSPDPEIRGTALHALTRLREPVTRFALRGTRDTSAAVRAQSAMLLVKPPVSTETYRRLREMLHDVDPGVRQTVAELLADTPAPHAPVGSL